MNTDAENRVTDFRYWQKAKLLEESRNHVLRLVVNNEDLGTILNVVCNNVQIYNADILSSILTFDSDNKTLHHIASSGLPESYCEAIDGIEIGPSIGSCGTAAYLKKHVIVEDINTHPYWVQYKDLANKAGLRACWSEPIMGANSSLYGTFALYYKMPKTPSQEDLKFIELGANLASIVFENHSNRKKLLTANKLLSQTIDKRNEELERTNAELSIALKKQENESSTLLNEEKINTTNSLLAGFSHEISTPFGIALTAIGLAEEKALSVQESFRTGKLSKKQLEQTLLLILEAIEINKTNLKTADDLLNHFKDINAEEDTYNNSSFPFYSL